MPVPPLLFLLARGRAAVTGSGHEGPVVDRARCLPVVLLADQGDVVHAGGAGGVVAAAGVFRAGLGVGVPGDVVRGRGPGILSVAPYEQDVQVEWVEDELHAPAGQRRVDLVLVSVQGNQGRLGDGPPFGPAERLGQIRFGWERERAAGFPAGQRRLPGLRMLPDVVDRLGPGGEQLVQLGQVLDPGGALLGQLDQELIPCGPEGAPQGGCASPVLSNIYLHRLDSFVETVLIPEYTRGGRRARNPAYLKEAAALARARRAGDRAEARKARDRMRSLPSVDPHDPGFRRLRYVRYCDDHLLGFTGPKAEAEEIKQRLAEFLREDLKLELSQDKTLITHARSDRASFLGYQISVQHDDRQRTASGQRAVNGAVSLHVPKSVIKAKSALYMKRGEPARRSQVINYGDYDIVGIYGAEYRGLVQYYLLAGDVRRLHRLRWVMLTSMLKTLASKHRSTATKIAAKHKAKIMTPHGPRTCFEAVVERGKGSKPLVARFGGIPLKRQKTAVINDQPPRRIAYPRKELIGRLSTEKCELCGRTSEVQVHQVRKLAELDASDPAPWVKAMTRRRRKTLVVCTGCHDRIHGARPASTFTA